MGVAVGAFHGVAVLFALEAGEDAAIEFCTGAGLRFSTESSEQPQKQYTIASIINKPNTLFLFIRSPLIIIASK